MARLTKDELTKANIDQQNVLTRAMEIYEERNIKYEDAWKQSGWRGALFDARKKVERAWTHLFYADSVPTGDPHDVDDLIDTINYCAFAIRAIEDGNRDGQGGWW